MLSGTDLFMCLRLLFVGLMYDSLRRIAVRIIYFALRLSSCGELELDGSGCDCCCLVSKSCCDGLVCNEHLQLLCIPGSFVIQSIL